MTLSSKQKNILFRLFSAILYGFCFLYFTIESNKLMFYLFIIILMTGSIYEILKINTKYFFLTILTIPYILISFFLLFKLKETMNGELLIIILLSQIWASDTGGYILGSVFGKKKISNISFNKTWEGVLGSMASCLIIGACLKNIIHENTELNWIIICLLICASSIIGDLIMSKIKRINNKKDSGFFLPGHGGFLDRLDSLFLATPIYYLAICI